MKTPGADVQADHAQDSGARASESGRAGSLIVSIVFLFAGVLTLYDTYSYSDIDSKVFPRAAAIVLVVCCLLSIVTGLLKGVAEPGFGRGSWWRRILLVAGMLIACLLMPFIGFLPAGIIAFAAGLLASMHQSWTLKTALIYSTSGLVVMVGFYSLFRFVLNVPLP